MEAKLTRELPQQPGWQFEPKWDGFRCLAFRGASRSISGRNRAIPEVVAFLKALKPNPFVLDGELA